MSQLISPWDILTSSGKYEDRIEDPSCVPGVRINAADLAERVSKLLGSIGRNAPVSSGFRTPKANGAANGAKVSAHLTGQALDLVDHDGSLARAITPHLLEQFDLYMENPQYTKGWVHLSTRAPASRNRVFNP